MDKVCLPGRFGARYVCLRHAQGAQGHAQPIRTEQCASASAARAAGRRAARRLVARREPAFRALTPRVGLADTCWERRGVRTRRSKSACRATFSLTAEPKPAAPPSRTQEQLEPPAAKTEPGEATTPAKAATAVVPTRQGPVDELAKRFAGESRGDSSTEQDARVRAAFVDPAIPPEMLHSVECRRSVCRAELRWTAQHDVGYVLGLTRAVGSLSAPLGIEAPGAPDDSGARPLVVYFGLTH